MFSEPVRHGLKQFGRNQAIVECVLATGHPSEIEGPIVFASIARVDVRFLSGQAEVLCDVEKKAKPFFDLVVAHTMQGFYGDPRHGGNRDAASWTMLGLAFPPVRGRAHYDKTTG